MCSCYASNQQQHSESARYDYVSALCACDDHRFLNYPFSQHHCRLVWYSVALHCFIIGAQSTDWVNKKSC